MPLRKNKLKKHNNVVLCLRSLRIASSSRNSTCVRGSGLGSDCAEVVCLGFKQDPSSPYQVSRAKIQLGLFRLCRCPAMLYTLLGVDSALLASLIRVNG